MSKGRMLISDWWLRNSNGRNRHGRHAVRGIARQRESRTWKREENADVVDPLSTHISKPVQREKEGTR